MNESERAGSHAAGREFARFGDSASGGHVGMALAAQPGTGSPEGAIVRPADQEEVIQQCEVTTSLRWS